MKSSLEVRDRLREVLQLDLVGPGNDHPYARELLPQSPQRWYLTGYLVPQQAPEEERKSKDEPDEEAQPADEDGKSGGGGSDDSDQPEPAVRVSYLPPSIGMSVLTKPTTQKITATIQWGDYECETEDGRNVQPEEIDRAFDEEVAREQAQAEVVADGDKKPVPADGGPGAKRKLPKRGFRREPRREQLVIEIAGNDGTRELAIHNSRGLKVVASWRALQAIAGTVVEAGTKAVSVFVVNDRACKGGLTFHELAFQVELELECAEGFVGRPDLRGIAFQDDTDADERIADLHYRDVLEYAVGHGVSATADEENATCKRVRTVWLPSEEVARVDHAAAARIGDVVLEMEQLGTLADGKAAERR